MKSKEKPKKTGAPTPRVPQVRIPSHVTLRGRGYNAPGVSKVPHHPRLSPPKQQEPPPKPRYESYHPLNCSLEHIFYQIRDNGLLRPPKPMKKYPNMKRNLKYCEFHEDFNHITSKCFSLREEIEYLTLSGYLKKFVVGIREARKSMEQDKSKHIIYNSLKCEAPQGPKKGVYVLMIAGDPT